MKQDFLDQVERQLVDATERGGKRRRFWHGRLRLRVPTFAATTVAVAAITATALAASLALPAGHMKRVAKPRTPPVRSLTSAGPVPAGFSPASFTAISEFTWWLLGTSPCDADSCTTIVQTQDGGRTFARIAAPPVGGGYQVRFANSQDGYVFGAQLWTTHNGGVSWRRVRLGGDVTQLAASWPYVYAIVQGGHGGGHLMRANATGGHWKLLSGAGDAYSGLWVQGSDVLLDSAGTELRLSHNDGATFVSSRAPPSVACSFEEAQANVVWAPCATGMLSGVWRSTDDGATFTPAGTDARASGQPMPNSAAFSAASATVAVLGYRQLYRTTDAGARYAAIPTPKGIEWWSYLGFTDATHGVALGSFPGGNRLYYTINAGTSYHYVPIDPT